MTWFSGIATTYIGSKLDQVTFCALLEFKTWWWFFLRCSKNIFKVNARKEIIQKLLVEVHGDEVCYVLMNDPLQVIET